MGIGVSILLIALGLILAVATDFDLNGLDIQVVGWILTAAGVLGLVMTMLVFAPRRRGSQSGYVEERRIEGTGYGAGQGYGAGPGYGQAPGAGYGHAPGPGYGPGYDRPDGPGYDRPRY